MRARTALILAVFCALISVVALMPSEDSEATDTYSTRLLLDYGNGQTTWYDVSGNTVGGAVTGALSAAGIPFDASSGIVVNGKGPVTFSDATCLWQFYVYDEGWVATAYDPSAAYSGESIALGYYPEGYVPTVTPQYKNAWTCIHGDALNSCNTNDYDPLWTNASLRSYYWNEQVPACYASPLVADGTYYQMARDYNNPSVLTSRHLVSIDLVTGTTNWDIAQRGGQYELSTGAIYGGKVYYSTIGAVYSIPLHSADPENEMQTLNVGASILPTKSTVMIGTSSIVYDSGHLFFGGSDGKVWCVTPDLQQVWCTQTTGGVYPSMSLTVANGLVYAGACDGKLIILDEVTGNIEASLELYYSETNGGRVMTPAVFGDTIMVSYADGAGMSAGFWAYAILHYDRDNKLLTLEHDIRDLQVQTNTAVMSPISECVYTSANNIMYRIYTDGTYDEVFNYGGKHEVHGGFTFVNNTYLFATDYDAKGSIIVYNMSGQLVGSFAKNKVPELQNYTMASTAVVGGYIVSGCDSGSFIVRGLMASGNDEPDPEHSSAPYYSITWKQDDGTVIDTTRAKEGTVPTHAAPTKAPTDQYTYTFLRWDPAPAAATADAEYTAVYTSTVNTYTIKWYNSTTLLKTDTVAYGDTPVYTGETPTKAPDAQYTYTFSGWKPAVVPVTKNASYMAQFSTTVNKYPISWLNEDLTLIYTEDVDYGTLPVYTGETPTKEPVETYVFSGWSPNVELVEGAASYTAVFTTRDKCTVTWVNYNGVVLETDMNLDVGTTPTYDGATPVHEPTADTEYTFTGWLPAVGPITESVTYTAQYSESVRKYDISWFNGDTLLGTDKVAYGTIPTYTGAAPTKDATAEYSYTFTGWDPAIVVVSEDAAYHAVFEETPNTYTITYKVNGTTASTENGVYGTEYVLPAIVPAEGYRSTEWTSTDVTIANGRFTMPAKDVTISRDEIRVFTITWSWVTNSGPVSDTTIVDIDTMPEHSDAPARYNSKYNYLFAGWDPTVVVATKDTTYTATYDQVATLYSVTYYVNGAVDDSVLCGYGTEVTVPDFPHETGYEYTDWHADGIVLDDGKFVMPDHNVDFYRTVTRVTVDPQGNTVKETVFDYDDGNTVTVTDTIISGSDNVKITAASDDGAVTATINIAGGTTSTDIPVTVPSAKDSTGMYVMPEDSVNKAVFMLGDIEESLPAGVSAGNLFLSSSTTERDAGIYLSSSTLTSMAGVKSSFVFTSGDASMTITPSVIEKNKASNVTFSMKNVDRGSMTDDQKKAVTENAVVLDLKALAGTTDIGGSLGGRILMTVNYNCAGKEPVIYFLPDTGKAQKIAVESYTDSTVTFYVDHFSYYAVDEKVTPASDNALAIVIVLAIAIGLVAVILFVCYRRARNENMSLAAYLKAMISGRTGGSKIRRNKRRLFVVCMLGFLLTLIMFCLNIAIGPSASLPFFDAISALVSAIGKGGHDLTMQEIIVYETRLPRALAAVAVGIGLSIAGCVYQAIIRNPLVDPYIMGVSSGAGTFAVAAISANFTFFGLLAANSFSTPILAAIGGLLAFSLTLIMAEKAGGSSTNYVLAGVIVGLVFSAIQTLLLVTSSNEHLTSAISWLFGSFANVGWGTVWMIFFPAIFLALIPLFWAKELNLVLLGEDQAKQMGLNVRRFNRMMLILASVLTSVCVAFVGIIGFVGMVIPHLARMMLGGDHRLVLPASIMMGGALMLFADFMSKMLMIPTELPVGAITTIIGVPVFAYLLIKKGRMYDG